MDKTREDKLKAYLFDFGEEFVKEQKKKKVSGIEAMESYQRLRKYFEDLNKRPIYQIRNRVLGM